MSSPSATRRVLVAEDDPDARALIVAHLTSVGCDVLECGDGPSALDALDAFSPEVLVLDIGLPRLDGFGVLERMRERPGGGVPTLVLTGRQGLEDVERARALGADDFLMKPYSPRQLLLRVTRLLVWARHREQQPTASDAEPSLTPAPNGLPEVVAESGR